MACCLFSASGAVAQASSSSCGNGFDPRPWAEDFQQLTAEMAAHYADLEYAVDERHMDLPALPRETEGKLGHSCDEREARKALKTFLDSFGDGHLEIDWPQPAPPNPEPKPANNESLCARLGYKRFGFKSGIEFSSLAQFTNIGGPDGEWFPGGVLRVHDAAKLGIIRIAIFSEHAYPDACQQTMMDLHLAEGDNCDKQCENTIERETANRLTAAIVRRSEQLRAAGASAILVDISGNGGGSNWVEAPPRALSRVPLREPRSGFIKHEHWTAQLKEKLADVEADLKNGAGPKDVLTEAAGRLRSGIARSEGHCDRSRIWSDGKLTCSLMVNDILFADSILPYAQPGSFALLESKTTLFHPLRYAYTESANRLPLYVVVDGNTWSAAEYFAAILQDNKAATIVGEVTGGAGCGYTNGGIPTQLKNSKAVVKMPDCVRYRKDGANEVAGVTPDVLVPWSAHDNAYLKAQKLFRSLATVITDPKEPRHESRR
jgi:hypothetical protein